MTTMARAKRLYKMENNKRPAQVDDAIDYMTKHGSISTLEAINDLGILSLSRRICEIKERGYLIGFTWDSGIDRRGKKWRAKRYYIIASPEEVGA